MTMSESNKLHEVDGIEEEDNKLPSWWFWGFMGTIVFALGYWFVFQVFHVGRAPVETYQAEKAAQAEAAAKRAVSPAELAAMVADPARIARGHDVFATTCIACHRADGGGLIGPNLTDSTWIHGGSPSQLIQTVTNGWPAKGMPSWGPILGAEKVKDVVSFVVSIKNTNVANGKAPEGIAE
jgi:cytochrome c oxidase cbb3-type subunit 3